MDLINCGNGNNGNNGNNATEDPATPATPTGKIDIPSPFDPERLRLDQSFLTSVATEKLLLLLQARRPDRSWFVRTHPDPLYRLEAGFIELRDDRELYLVDPRLHPELPGEIIPKLLITSINSRGLLFLWPIRLPGADGRIDEWNRIALEAAQLAMTRWVRIAANRETNMYDVSVAHGLTAEPEWPKRSFKELLEIAFRDHYINDINHVVLRRLRGEI
jgi:hypothetical protein